ncbi:MAG: BTB/POZ domain-containing protein [Terriglobus roseus]|nr:BTB/POZ domain-containing protein [Terriglobus roseus]
MDIYVGSEHKHWSLHRNLLCYHSEWLKDELEPPQLNDGSPKEKRRTPEKENQAPRLTLEEIEPSGFELLVKWMYQGSVEDVDTILDDQAKYEYAVACHKLYILCSKLEIPALGNIAIDQYRKGLHTTSLVPDAEEINHIYRSSPAGSPFRKLMTQIAARQIMDPESDKDAENYRQCFEDNPEFCIDLVNAIKEGSGGILFDDPTDGDECGYHNHVDGPNCHIKKKGRAGK